jgi:hypothetical protein
MATDLRKARTTGVEETRQDQRGSTKHSRWPYVATAIVLAVLVAVAVLVFTQGGSQPVVGPDQWATNVDGMMTDVREGSGYAPTEPSDAIPDLMTDVREASGYQPVEPTDPRHPLGSTRYADSALTKVREAG